jgi:hypothetical protein
VTQNKHACPLAQKHTPNPKRLLSTQFKRQEAPPKDELHWILKMSFSCLPVGAQQMHNTKPFSRESQTNMQILEFCCNFGEEKNFLQQTIFPQIAIPTTQIQNHSMIIIKSDFLRASSGREKKQGGKQTNKQTNK